ncbi:LacI family DNA-binding transcriptional regulator [Streptacidiphilus sp. N1-10]|uniref:LacI family DNA-binding transcriptional regulator n=1 Tax=Streptacidiphilus jeojiensis TaxID=3229225 RepID=A0ABV6XPJ2_9ACTN
MGEPTLHDVAARAGVSIKTVSNVLRGVTGKVSAETSARVLQVIEEIGYRPNLSARRLRSGRSNVVALAVPDLRNPYFAEVATAMISAARQAGYTLLIEETGGNAGDELNAAEGLRDPLIEGVIMAPLALDPRQLDRRGRTVPLVLLGEHDYDGDCDHVMFDNLTASQRMTAHLIEQGYRRIAVIGRQDAPPQAAAMAAMRFNGYRRALTEAGLAYDQRLAPVIATTAYGKAAGAEAAEQIFARGLKPDALYCFADVLAIGALRAAHCRGLHAPEDFGLAGFDGIEEGRFTIPTLTTIAPDYADMAALAVNALIERMESTVPIGHRDILCRYELEVRESTQPGLRTGAAGASGAGAVRAGAVGAVAG